MRKWEVGLAEANEVKLRLDGKMRNLRKRKEYQIKIRNIDRKVAWLLYDALKVRFEELQDAKQRIQTDLEEKRRQIAPLEEATNNARKTIDTIQERIAALVLFKNYSKVESHFFHFLLF